jgi:cytochrome bd-type quinol oxidase subunit 2
MSEVRFLSPLLSPQSIPLFTLLARLLSDNFIPKVSQLKSRSIIDIMIVLSEMVVTVIATSRLVLIVQGAKDSNGIVGKSD